MYHPALLTLRRPTPFVAPYRTPTLYSPHSTLTSSAALLATEHGMPETPSHRPPTQESGDACYRRIRNTLLDARARLPMPSTLSLSLHNVKTLSGENIVRRPESEDLLGEVVCRCVTSNSFFSALLIFLQASAHSHIEDVCARHSVSPATVEPTAKRVLL